MAYYRMGAEEPQYNKNAYEDSMDDIEFDDLAQYQDTKDDLDFYYGNRYNGDINDVITHYENLWNEQTKEHLAKFIFKGKSVKMQKRLWASKDRCTVWSKTYEKILEDGTVHSMKVEKIKVANPCTQQLRLDRIGIMMVIDASIPLFNKTTMQPVKYTEYYNFSDSYHGGPNAESDWAHGFSSGRYCIDCFKETHTKNLAKLRKDGFKLNPTIKNTQIDF